MLVGERQVTGWNGRNPSGQEGHRLSLDNQTGFRELPGRRINPQRSAMTVGWDVTDAYNKMGKLEHTARAVLAVGLQGPLPPLLPAEVEKLRRLGEKYKEGG